MLIRSVILYLLVVFSVRLMGKRQIGELQPNELVIAMLVSNVATLPLEDTNMPLFTGVIPILTLVCLDVFISWFTLKSYKFRKFVSGRERIVISNGIIDQKMLKELRFSVDDLLMSLRASDIFDVSKVQFAIIETNGSLSIYEKTSDDTQNPPEVIIADGVLFEKKLNFLNRSLKFLNDILAKNKTEIKDVFLLTVKENGEYYLVKKETK